jgi:hypothetical protein
MKFAFVQMLSEGYVDGEDERMRKARCMACAERGASSQASSWIACRAP